ncbi:MAG: enoyl-CoA hydratase-related protein [Acidimicrobiales bacterium]
MRSKPASRSPRGDFRLAARSAKMGSATLRFGLLPDEGGQFLLVQHLGVAGAMDFLMRKRIVDADAALELGLVHEVTNDDALMPAAPLSPSSWPTARRPPCACSNARSIWRPSKPGPTRSRTSPLAPRSPIITPMRREGGRAFAEKRVPVFNRDLGHEMTDLDQPSVADGELTHRQVMIILSGLLLGIFAAVDGTIVSTALPTIVGELGGFDQLTWWSPYFVTSTAATPLYGKVSDLPGAESSTSSQSSRSSARRSSPVSRRT